MKRLADISAQKEDEALLALSKHLLLFGAFLLYTSTKLQGVFHQASFKLFFIHPSPGFKSFHFMIEILQADEMEELKSQHSTKAEM